MQDSIVITPGLIVTAVLAAAGAVVTVWSAIKAVSELIKTIKAPNAAQSKEIADLQEWKNGELREWQKEVDRKLNRDKEQLESIQDGLRASYQAQLALLDHGIDGNNIKQMQDAKEALQNHLINHK